MGLALMADAVVTSDSLRRAAAGVEPVSWAGAPGPRRVTHLGEKRAQMAQLPPRETDPRERIRIVVADANDLYRQGMKVVIDLEPDFEIVAEAASAHEAVETCLRLRPDVVLLGQRMPGTVGMGACETISKGAPDTKVLVLAADDDDDLYAALQAGATGFLFKGAPAQQIVESVHLAHGGQSVIPAHMASLLHAELAGLRERARVETPSGLLTERELEVLRLMAVGRANKAIASRLFISENTVKRHVRTLTNKLQVNSRVEVALFALQHGLVEEED
ncbi:response regulator transcription factor [Knoellia sp. S7-12]|uniref:response regulator transcription factor n=1 Tax=Knoellia sp. S7-12 TaxID=3126698 RepID=UPI0033663D66